ncbi:hypothetical protein, partial [Burkholderia vietnamiensis]|uniref:hypothetical protein n=1 Tax=Burkholderia vietnamiensis TaxID=60552 RepID=UPI001E5D8CAA
PNVELQPILFFEDSKVRRKGGRSCRNFASGRAGGRNRIIVGIGCEHTKPLFYEIENSEVSRIYNGLVSAKFSAPQW